MKRLVLMGGRPWLSGDRGKVFTDRLFRYSPNELKLAFCIFAQPEIEWAETEKWNKSMFDSFKGQKSIIYKTMTERNFTDVSKWADIIYIPGGDPYKLKNEILAVGDTEELWDDKIIAGSSAGADLFCAKFVYLQDKNFGAGLAWINATCIPHWRGDFKGYSDKDWDWVESESLQRFPNLPVLCIPEGESIEVTIN